MLVLKRIGREIVGEVWLILAERGCLVLHVHLAGPNYLG